MRFWYFGSLCLMMVSLAACTASGADAEPADRIEAPTATVVRTIVVGAAPVAFGAGDISVSGTVVSEATAQPGFKTGGLLTSVRVEEGDEVKRGQVLATINATELAAGEAQAQAGLDKATRDMARVAALFADSVATRTQRDDAATAVEVARRQLEAVKFNAGLTSIRSPISGRVVRQLARAGETVGPGQPVLVLQGTAAGDWRVLAALTDEQWAATQEGQAAEVSFDAYPAQTFVARVTERAAAANPSGGTFNVTLTLEDPPVSLAAGLLARVVLAKAEPELGSTTDQPFTIPLAALGRVNGKTAEVFVFEGDRVRGQQVSLGQLSGERVQILDGLTAGVQLVVTGVAWLRDGDAVLEAESAVNAKVSTAAPGSD